MMQQLSKYSACLTWVLIGVLVVSVPLASILTLHIKNKYSSITTTTVTTASTQVNQTNSSQATRQTYSCGNISPYTLWQTFSIDGITMTIDTSSCSFNSTPLYFISMAGVTYHWVLTGYGAIYLPSKSVFTVYARSTDYPNATQLLGYSQTYRWNVTWFGLLN